MKSTNKSWKAGIRSELSATTAWCTLLSLKLCMLRELYVWFQDNTLGNDVTFVDATAFRCLQVVPLLALSERNWSLSAARWRPAWGQFLNTKVPESQGVNKYEELPITSQTQSSLRTKPSCQRRNCSPFSGNWRLPLQLALHFHGGVSYRAPTLSGLTRWTGDLERKIWKPRKGNRI